MPFIRWTSALETGIESIDEQHRQLVEIVNRFDEASRRGRGTRVMQDLLTDLLGYIQEHFAHEESLMAAANFPDLEKHQGRHRQLLQKVERLHFEFAQDGRRVTGELRELLTYWVESHILHDDMAFSAQIAQDKINI